MRTNQIAVPAIYFCFALILVTGCARPNLTPQPPIPQQPSISPRHLAKKIGFPEKLVVSLQRYGTNFRQLVGMDAEGADKPAPGLVMDVSGSKWHQLVRRLRQEVGQGYLVFCSDQGFGSLPDQIAVLRGKDQFDILRAVGTAGGNYNLGPEQVLARAREWDRQYGLDIIAAGHDWMEARFKRPPADMDAFAKEVHNFCPDVVDQGTGSVQELAREMKQMNGIYLWWD
jgi:hypothetical protein